MPIPDLNADGHLPQGVHLCTLEEVKGRFGTFQSSDRRLRIFERLTEFVGLVRGSGRFAGMVIDGSFVTEKAIPNDVDLILVLHRNHDFGVDLTPSDYALMNRRAGRRLGFDVLIAREGGLEYEEYVTFFAQVRGKPHQFKGMVRINL